MRERERLGEKVRGNRQIEFTYIIRFTEGCKTEARAAGFVGLTGEKKSLNNVAARSSDDSNGRVVALY